MEVRLGSNLRWPWVLAGLYAIAAALRLMLLDGPLYGDEAVQYAMSRHWGADPSNVVPEYALNRPLWWGRLMFPLVLSPGAALGLDAFRIEHALLAALLPVLVAGLTRRAGAQPLVAAGAGLAAAIHPTLVLWGARVFPDTLMACFVLAALWAHVAGRPVLTGLLFVAAVWTKETAGLALALLMLWVLWRGRVEGRVGLWPARLDERATALLGACLLAPWPLVYSIAALQGRVPGWSEHPLAWGHVSGLFGSLWLLLPILLGLLWRRSRAWSLFAFAYPAFYVAYGLSGRGVEGWYVVLPSVLALVATATSLDAGMRQAASKVRSPARVGAAVVALLFLAIAVVPDTVAAKHWATPGGATSESLLQLSDRLEGDDLADAIDRIREDQWDVVLLIDVGWFHVHYPFAERAVAVGWAYSIVELPMEDWTYAVENSDATVLLKVDQAMNQALRSTYSDCIAYENASYVLIEGRDCPGRTERLGFEYQRQSMG